MQRDVTISGVGMTRFESAADDDLPTLLERAATRALDDSDLPVSDLTSVHVGNMAAEAFDGISGLHNRLAASLGAYGVRADRVENTSASGASAFQRAVEAVASGASEHALVVGGEKMSVTDTETATGVIGSIVHSAERAHGLTLPSFGGLAAATYLRRYDADPDCLHAVAVKNHANGARNPYAQFQRRVTLEDARDSPLVADPLRLYDCSPMSDGAAAAVVSAGGGDVRVRACESAVGTHAVMDRPDVLEISSVATASERAFRTAGVDRGHFDVACVHDAFTVLELLELEEMGFYGPGEAWKATMDGETERDGRLPVNPGGGLKARGHPLGATGVSQLVELTWQLRGDAGERQVCGSEVGLALNVAGFGNNAVCTVLEGGA